jgi:hypothetical protein
MAYLLDANVFIQAKNLHYGFDFCPAFWDWIDKAHDKGAVYSVDSVRTELIAGNDDLAAWANQRAGGFFLSPDAATVPSLQAMSTWATSAGYDPAAVTTFLQIARLLPGLPGTRTAAHRGHPRDRQQLSQADQNPERLPRHERQVRHAFRHAPRRARQIYARSPMKVRAKQWPALPSPQVMFRAALNRAVERETRTSAQDVAFHAQTSHPRCWPIAADLNKVSVSGCR